MRRNTHFVLTMLFTLLFGGCVWEDMTNCDVYLHIKYDYNKNGINQILEEVDQLDLFIFLEDGRLYKRLSLHPKIDGTSVKLPLEGGTYHLMAWGNLPPPTHQEVSYYYDTHQGKLVYQSEDLAYQDSILGLFWGETESFTMDGDNLNSIELSLIKNTKHIDVVVVGGAFSDTRCELFAENRNHDNKNIPSSLLNSQPKIDTESGNLVYRFNTHRLLASDAAKSGLRFYGRKPHESEIESIVNTSLIDLLLANPYIDDLDRFDHYTIKLEFTDGFLSPRIYVNDWLVIDMPEDL